MAFWGVDLKPGNPYKHRYDESRGRLHISQATLGFGQSTKKSVVQCNVGERCPVLLCSLLPEKTESCSLNLEFEEEDEVVFSVIGPRSVHLTGFFLGPTGDLDNHYEEDSDSYGEDIAETETEPSSDYDSEDEYEDGFIDDDDDLEIYPPSPRPNSGVRIEEIVDEETPRDGTGTNEHLKKKHQHSDSDAGDVSQQQIVVKNTITPVLESEDEDGFPVSTTSKSKHILKDAGAKNRLDKKMNADEMKDKVEDNRSHSACMKRKIDAINQDGKMDRVSDPPSDSFVPSGGVTAQDGEKSKKKKKEKVKNKKNTEAEDGNLPGEELNEKLSNDKEAVDSTIFSSTVDPESTGKSKKKKKGKAKDKNLQPEGDPSAEAVDKACQDDDNKPTHVKEATNEAMDQDPPIKAEEANTKLPDDDVGRNGSAVPDEHKEGKKKKRKKSKTHEGDTNTIREEAKLESEEVKRGLFAKLDEQKTEARPSKPRTFSNGLVIEELSMGKPDGKRASPGNRVSVYYIGKLKKNGEIFDSNIGKRPFKFRLGIGQVIKGWDVGIAGMRVGDKRRLTIPPSMGYGSKGAGGKIPGNAWLVFDVELVDVQ